MRAFIHSVGESFEIFRNVTQLNHEIALEIICFLSYGFSCETNTLKIFYVVRTHIFQFRSKSLINCPSVKGFELDKIKCNNP
jgi:hypothetical protein